MQEKLVDYILINKIASETPYSQEYLSLLIRKGKIHGRKTGKNWMISKNSLAEYLQSHLQGQTFSTLDILRSDFSDANRSVLASGVEMGVKGQKGIETKKWVKNDLDINTKKELDELEKIYQNKISPSIPSSGPRGNNESKEQGQTFSTLDTLRSDLGDSESKIQNQYEQIDLAQKSYFKKTMQWVGMVVASILVLGYILGDFNFGFIFDLYELVKSWLGSL